MKKLLLAVSLLGCLLFSLVFAVTLVSPSIIDRSARQFVIYQIEKEIARRQIAGVNLGQMQEKLSWLRERYADQISAVKGQLESGLRIEISDILDRVCDVGCLHKKGIKISDVTEEKINEEIAQLTGASAKLGEMIRGKYYSTISELLSDIRIFSGLNALLFLFVALILSSKSFLLKPLALPAGLLFIATVIGIGLYVLGQNWFYTVIFNDYVGYGYLGYVGMIFALLVDIAFNEGSVTLSVLEAAAKFVKAAASCCPSV